MTRGRGEIEVKSMLAWKMGSPFSSYSFTGRKKKHGRLDCPALCICSKGKLRWKILPSTHCHGFPKQRAGIYTQQAEHRAWCGKKSFFHHSFHFHASSNEPPPAKKKKKTKTPSKSLGLDLPRVKCSTSKGEARFSSRQYHVFVGCISGATTEVTAFQLPETLPAC